MNGYQVKFDLHTHSIASGHGTLDSISTMAGKAAGKGLSILGISDHGPGTVNSGSVSYFQGLVVAPKIRYHIRILYGVELNILNENGMVDLDDSILKKLDYAIVSMHTSNFKPGTCLQNTMAYKNAIQHPNVRIIGHCDDKRYEVDYEDLFYAAVQNKVVFEINNASLKENSYRPDAAKYDYEILRLCKKHNYPVVLSSDSHGADEIGDFTEALKMIDTSVFPKELILNYNIQRFKEFIKY